VDGLKQVTVILLLLIVGGATARAQPEATIARPKLAVLDLKAERGLDQGLVKLLNELLLSEFTRAQMFEVVGGSDIDSMLKFEEKKRLFGCTDISCLSEIGGALGVEKIAVASIGKVGTQYLTNVKIIDVRLSRVDGRVSHKSPGSEDALMQAITTTVRELLKARGGVSEPVPTVTKEAEPAGIGVLPITLWSTGGAGLAAGLVFGFLAKEHQDNANDPGFVGGQLEIDKARTDQLVANIAFGVGGACLVAGLLVWLLSDSGPEPATAVVPLAGNQSLGVGLVMEY
jgi:hypothetical protein